MHNFRGIQNPWRCHWSDAIQKKTGSFFGKSCSRNFGDPGCHASTLIDFANTALARKRSVKPICKISEGYRTHGAVTGPMNFKKLRRFFREIVLPGFWDPGCHPCTLIDLVNTALARRDFAENICMISEGYRTHTVVTGPMNFKKLGRFSGKLCSRGFGAPGCHPGTLIDLVNTALACKISVQPKCMISEGYRAQGGVNGPMNFKKKDVFFSENRAPGILGPCLPSKHLN